MGSSLTGRSEPSFSVPFSDMASQPEDPNAGKTPEEIAAEAERRRKAEEARQARARKNAERAELRRQAEEEAERMAKETPEERALRERQAVEKADYAMADELFGAPGQPSSRPLSSLSLSSSTSSVGAGKVSERARGPGMSVEAALCAHLPFPLPRRPAHRQSSKLPGTLRPWPRAWVLNSRRRPAART